MRSKRLNLRCELDYLVVLLEPPVLAPPMVPGEPEPDDMPEPVVPEPDIPELPVPLPAGAAGSLEVPAVPMEPGKFAVPGAL